MKKYIFVLLVIVLSFSSCATSRGDNYSAKAEKLYPGMSKQEALKIMGNKYIIESVSEEEREEYGWSGFDVFSFRSQKDASYRLLFKNDELISFNQFIFFCPPPISE